MNENAPRLEVEYRPTAALLPYAQNSNLHSPEQVAQIASSIQTFGFTNPILVDGSGVLIAGHGRLLAAQRLGWEQVPCIVLGHLTEAQQRAYVIADNKLAKNSTWDMEVLISELGALAAMGDLDLSLTGFNFDEIDAMLRDDGLLPEDSATAATVHTGVSQKLPQRYNPPNVGALAQRFGAPPLSVFDTRQGYWQARKRVWLSMLGDTSETKEGVLTSDTIMKTINNGSSGFDPVLAELVFTWFCLPGGRVLDPFAGEQTKGYVAGYLGYQYDGVEFRPEQVELNRQVTAGMEGVRYVAGDSNNLKKLVPGKNFDLVFTSPPYYDLEVYSAADMSALPTYGEFMAQYGAIFAQCVDKLAKNRFLVVKVGEIRDKKTGAYRNFVGDNVTLFTSLGLHYYNEIVIVNPIGTAAIRAGRSFRLRKTTRVHQTLLVFYKGDMGKITETFGEIQFDHDLENETAE